MTIRQLLLAAALVLVPVAALPEAPAADAPLPPPPAPALDAAAPPALAADLPVPPPPPDQPAPLPFPKWGVAVGGGVPQAATLDVIYRPLPWLRLQAGPSWDYGGWGGHGGVVLSPIRWAISPTLGFEAGRFADVNVAKIVTGTDAQVRPLLEAVRLQYMAATLGLEFGSQRGFAFSLRTGLAWVQVLSHGTSQLTSGGTVNGASTVITVSNPTFRASTPTLQLGFQYFI